MEGRIGLGGVCPASASTVTAEDFFQYLGGGAYGIHISREFPGSVECYSSETLLETRVLKQMYSTHA